MPVAKFSLSPFSSSSVDALQQSEKHALETRDLSEMSITDKPRPIFAQRRGPGFKVYSLVQWKNNEMIADYVLFEDSMAKCKVPWLSYNGMTSDERSIYLAHYKAVQDRKLSYVCPVTKTTHKSVSQLLYEGTCCGEGCRHCPYELQNCNEKMRKIILWNGAYYV